jgi:hypothetical protein
MLALVELDPDLRIDSPGSCADGEFGDGFRLVLGDRVKPIVQVPGLGQIR